MPLNRQSHNKENGEQYWEAKIEFNSSHGLVFKRTLQLNASKILKRFCFLSFSFKKFFIILSLKCD